LPFLGVVGGRGICRFFVHIIISSYNEAAAAAAAAAAKTFSHII